MDWATHFNKLSRIKSTARLLVIVILIFLGTSGCSTPDPGPTIKITHSPTLPIIASLTIPPITATASPTINPTKNPTITPTPFPETSYKHRSINPESAQFYVIRKNCAFNQNSTLDSLAQNCLYSGIYQDEFLNFGNISMYHFLRITYTFENDINNTEDYLGHFYLSVYKFEQDGDYQNKNILLRSALQPDSQESSTFFVDVDLVELQKSGYIAFYLALREIDEYVLRTDHVIFYEKPTPTLTATKLPQPVPTLTATKLPQPVPTQAPSSTNTPLPTITITPTLGGG
jgi:hypothetical protein